MTKEELKTLNDLYEEHIEWLRGLELIPEISEVEHFNQHLKAEVIKWVKAFSKMTPLDREFNAYMGWKTFFNLTEEDLK